MNSDELQRISPTLSSSAENYILSEGKLSDTNLENDTSTSALLHSVSNDNINSESGETLDLYGGFCDENGQALCKSEKVDLVGNSQCFQSIPVITCFRENEVGKALDGSGVGREAKTKETYSQQRDRQARSGTGNDNNAFDTTFAANSNIDVYLHSSEKEKNESSEPAVYKDDEEETLFVSAPPHRNEKNASSRTDEIPTLSAYLSKIEVTTKQQDNIAHRGQESQGISVSGIDGNRGLPDAKCGSENNGETLDKTKTKPRIVVNSKSKSEIEKNDEAGVSGDTRNAESENEAGSASPLVGRKLKSKIIEEKFKEYEKENKAKQIAVRKKLKFMVGNAEKAIVEARMIAQERIVAKRLEDASHRNREFLRVRTMRNRSIDGSVSPAYSNISYSSMSDRSKTPNEDKIEDNNLARRLQADLDRAKAKRWNTVNRRPQQSYQQLKTDSPASDKSTSDENLSPKSTSKGCNPTKFERYEVEWLILELRNLNLFDQAHNLSFALRKKEDSELQLRLELRRERKRAKEMARRAKKAELERERREEKKRKQVESERRARERLERSELERQRQLEEDRKRREHDKILLANFNQSVFATSISRSNTFSYFPLLVNKPPDKPKEQRRLSAVKSRQCALITSKYRQSR